MNSSSRIPWLDNIRVLACVLVIVSHIVGQFFVIPPFSPESNTFFWASLYTVLVRISIPLFFMISGALLLPVEVPTRTFLGRRFVRVLAPFFAWSVLYTIFPWCYEMLTGDSFKTIFPLSRATADLSSMGTNLLLIPLKFSVGIHLWYVYVLIGLYLFAPIISPWIKKAGKKEFLYFLSLWGVTLFFPYIHSVFPSYLGKCPWNEYGALHSFAGYLGYMVLGCFLRKYCERISFGKTVLWAVPCFAASFWFTWHFYRVSTMEAQSSSGTFINFASINVALMALSIFTLFQGNSKSSVPRKFQNALSHFSQMSFGIYLVHFFMVGAVYRFFEELNWLDIPAFVSIPLLTLATCLVSYLVIKLLSCLPGSKYLIG